MTTTRDYANLVQDERVHGLLFWDPQIFADEIERLWSRLWIYVGHESEVSTPGTFARKKLGLQPVVLTRAIDGRVHVLFNRCVHSANLVCHEERGAANSLRCPFHGWIYALDGRNVGVPFPEGYGHGFDKAEHSLAKPVRVDSYRGFVFASQSASGPTLREYLGPAAGCLDAVCDLSPEGELDLTATPFTQFERFATRDVELHGQPIRKGDCVLIHMASANFDPQAIDHPDELDLASDPSLHVSFGRGPHACLGKHVATLEMKVLLEELPQRTKEVVPAGP